MIAGRSTGGDAAAEERAEQVVPVPMSVLADDPDVSVMRAALGLTLYLDQPMVWAREGARAVLAGFLERIPMQELRWFSSSVRPGYRPVTGADLATLLRELPLPLARQQLRHLLWIRIVDNPHAARLAFSYREIDSERQRRCGVLELTFPTDLDPRVLNGFVAQIGDQWPFLAGVAGYRVSWNAREAATGMAAAFPCCRRFVGLDLDDPDRMAWQLPHGLPGTGWLTLIGRGHAEALGIDLDELARQKWTHPVAARALKQGLLLQAGEAPSYGDVNQLGYPGAYAEVARALAAHFVPAPPPFAGDAWREEPDRTLRWFRRLVEPEGWQ